MRLIWASPAQTDMQDIRHYIAMDNPAAAIRTGDRIFSAVQSLRGFPHQGRRGRAADTRELVIPGVPYIVIYQTREDHVQILRVMHTSRMWPQTSENNPS